METKAGEGGPRGRGFFIQVGDLLVKSALRFQRPIPPKSLWGSTSPCFFRGSGGECGGAGQGGPSPTPGAPCPESPQKAAVARLHKFSPPSRGRCCCGRHGDGSRFYF